MILTSIGISNLFKDGVTERQILDILTFLADSGFTLRDNLGLLTSESGLRWALSLKHYELYRFLWGSTDLLNVWTLDAFHALTATLVESHQSLLDFHFNAGACLFLAQPQASRLAFVKDLFTKYSSVPQVLSALTQSHYAPYLLVQLIDKNTYMKVADYTVYERCLEYSTHFELEELSKSAEVEETVVKFLKYIEILSSSDVRNVQGQKLISMIFSIDKYKAYQNVSLQLFDQQSLLVYEDEEEGGISEGPINGK